jgi:hypothetical protein
VHDQQETDFWNQKVIPGITPAKEVTDPRFRPENRPKLQQGWELASSNRSSGETGRKARFAPICISGFCWIFLGHQSELSLRCESNRARFHNHSPIRSSVKWEAQ